MKISGTICASLTPFNKDYSINHNLFFNHCKNLLVNGADKIVIFGTTGEANLISLDEKIEAMTSLIDNGFNADNLLPGTGLTSIEETIKLSKHANRLKMSGVLILPSCYYRNLTNQGLIDYYSNIVDSVANQGLKLILYHIPQISGVPINFDVIEKLIKKYPDNVVGIKDSSNDINNMLEMVKTFPGFSVFSGSDSLALLLTQSGGAGAITASANISLPLLSYLVKNANDKTKNDTLVLAQSLQDKIRKIIFSQEQIAFMKAVMNILTNSNDWDVLIPPLIPLNNPKDNENLIEILELIKEMNKLSRNF